MFEPQFNVWQWREYRTLKIIVDDVIRFCSACQGYLNNVFVTNERRASSVNVYRTNFDRTKVEETLDYSILRIEEQTHEL